MDMIEVSSSNVAKIGFDSGTLAVEFRDGSRYEYAGVPEARFHELAAAESKGKWLNAFIVERAGVKTKASANSVVSPPALRPREPIHTTNAEDNTCCKKHLSNASLSGALDKLFRDQATFTCPRCGAEYNAVTKPGFGTLVLWEYVCDVLVMRPGR